MEQGSSGLPSDSFDLLWPSFEKVRPSVSLDSTTSLEQSLPSTERGVPIKQSSSFVDRAPSSFGGCSQSSFVGRQPSSFGGIQRSFDGASSFTHGRPSIGNHQRSRSGGIDQQMSISDYIGISLVGKKFKEINPSAYYVEKDDLFLNREKDEKGPAIKDLVPPEKSKVVVPSEASSSKLHGFLVEPLFTMKRFDRYAHAPNEDLLVQFAKSHYDEDNAENVYDIIHPPLKEQIVDPESFKIFSETAFKCVKDQRAQRPNIDQILRNLEEALEIQKKLDNPPEQPLDANENKGTSSNPLKAVEHLRISLTDILVATKNFTKRFLGSGAYGKVYAAELDVPIEAKSKGEVFKRHRTTVAIKCIKKDADGRKGFVAEIELLTRCKHDNIVSLLGFCDEGDQLILVYEYVSNGSLDDYLGVNHKLTNLTWVQRLKICTDIARGLKYLHTTKAEDEESIVHRDIKSGNILLSKNWVAKISDFGLSKFHHVDEQEKTRYSKNIAGTNVYMCPEYRKGGKFKRAIDIYSFGVVLFEILSGKPAYDNIYITENEDGIAHVARRRFKEQTLNEMVDPIIMEEVDELASTLNKGPDQDSLETFLAIAHKCVAETQKERPPAEQILEELEKSLLCQENKTDNLQMSFEDIQSATQDFARENIIGGGGFGKVYKGEATRGNERRTIVAKRMDKNGGQGEHHFLMELEVLFEYKHDNIIGLEGYCNEKDEKIIVYEHAPKISLERYLKDDSLTWTRRLKICIDVASGLAFLHGGAATNEIVIHRDIKCANILLNGDWKAKISDFGLSAITTANQEVISNLVGTDGYVDPVFEVTGHFTEKSDIYSFGVVLFEILYGKLLLPNTKNYDKEQAHTILMQIHNEEKLDSIVFKAMKNDIAPESLSTFRMIVSQCLQLDRKKRPTADEVLQHLNKALEFQEDYEIWKPKLPQDYEEIIKKSKCSSFTERKKDLYSMFTKGILLQDDKVWFSLGSSGKRNAMISARKFSYRNRSPHMWQSVTESRFQKVAKMLDISNLMIKIKTTSKYLSPAVGYGVYLVFKFCNLKELSSKPMYVNLKYRKRGETFHAYFATWRDKEWMMIELDRFINQTEDIIFKFLLESLSPYYYADDDAIYVEGIEFRAVNNVEHKEIEKLTEVQQVLKSNLKNVDQAQEFPPKSEEISEKSNDGEKLLRLSEMNRKKHLMLSARTTLYNSSDLKLYKSTPAAKSRFQEVFELLPQQVFRINCTIKAQILSPDIIYVCYLVFKLSEECQGFHCPVEVRDLLHQENKEAEIVYFKTPSPWNIHDITQVPKQREDGWLEVNVWKTNSDHALKNDLPVNLKFRSYEGTMSSLIVCGLEFRPL